MLPCFSKFLKLLQTVIFVACTHCFVIIGDALGCYFHMYHISKSLYVFFATFFLIVLCFSSIHVPVLLYVPVILRGKQH